MKSLVALLRLLRAGLHLLRGLFIIYTQFSGMPHARRQAHIQAWSQQMLVILGMELRQSGAMAAKGPMLLVCNHISWVDITVLHACGHCRFISKADLKTWPVIGRLATECDTLYVERESRRDAMRVVLRMQEALAAGDVLAVFPEGTTSDGTGLLPFHANLLQAAIAAEAPVQPLALVFLDAAGQRTTAPAYIGDDSLLTSVWRTVSAAPLVAHVRFGQPERANGKTRREWAASLQQTVSALQNG